MTDTFYRWHRTDLPEFSAEHAWSGLWGQTFSTDGSQSECPVCDGSREGCFGEPCAECDGEGWQDCMEGYSCCDSAQELRDYMVRHLLSGADDNPGEGDVIVFTGIRTGTGFDGEPLVVPDGELVRRITWQELITEATPEG